MNFSLAEADWGIEEPALRHKRFDSVSTGEFSQPAKIRDYPARSPSLYNRSSSFGYASDTYRTGASVSGDQLKSSQNFVSIYPEASHNDMVDVAMIAPTTENFDKYIAKYLSLAPLRMQTVEKFKYNLVLSNLLDDSLVLSKNEHALTNLLKSRKSEDTSVSLMRGNGNNLGRVSLKILSKKYRLYLPRSSQTPQLLVNTISLIIFLMKQGRPSPCLSKESRISLFGILLIISTSIMRCRRVRATIESARSLRRLDDFMISNCYVNKVLIGHVIAMKETDVFSFLKQDPRQAPSETPDSYAKDLKSHVNTLLTCLILNSKHSIRELLPLSNGELLEKYCQINNVQVSTICQAVNPSPEEALSLETLTEKLAVFNAHRRFFICQLLTIHDSHAYNFFLLTLCDQYNVNVGSFPKYVSTSHKEAVIEEMFRTHTNILDQLLALNKKFKELHTYSQSPDYANDDILKTRKTYHADPPMGMHHNSDLALNGLIDKLQNIVVSLKHFKKYTQSIADLDNVEEHEERLAIFSSLQSELKTCVDVSGHCMSDYNVDFSAKFNNMHDRSSGFNSQRNSQNGDSSFNPKVFRTLSESSKSRISPSTEKHNSSYEDKRPQRVSAGLQLGVLTVPGDSQRRAINDRRDSAVHTVSGRPNHDSYNQAALEALTKKPSTGQSTNRFSMASMNSNVSGFSDYIASTQITTDEDDGEPKTSFLPEGADRGMSKAELASKLEESLARIYNLENENQNLKGTAPVSEPSEEVTMPGSGEPFVRAARDTLFLKSLEKSLNAKSPQ